MPFLLVEDSHRRRVAWLQIFHIIIPLSMRLLAIVSSKVLLKNRLRVTSSIPPLFLLNLYNHCPDEKTITSISKPGRADRQETLIQLMPLRTNGVGVSAFY